ncbi:hypothetical protein BH23GEM2_BH23GEM2_07310 [soil metagenome]
MLALATIGCGRDASTPDVRTATASREPDPIVVRVPRAGGTARATVYPALDSIIWEASGFPAVRRVLGFDAEAGLLAVTATNGRPVHLDLRLGRATVASRDSLQAQTSTNGSDIYGIDTRGRVLRLSPTGPWTFTPPAPADGVHAQPDGAILVSSRQRNRTTLWRVYPPDDRILDTAYLPPVGTAIGTQTGDRLYFTTDTAVIAVTGRTLEPARSVRTRERVTAAASTPSGDRLYLAHHGMALLRVVDRFAEGPPGEIILPDEASDLRMDPLGRYVLARSAGTDTVWVVAVGTGRLVATLPSRWTNDLPTVAPDGAIATLGERDVTFMDPESGREVLRAQGGAADFWIFFHWNGFRPRAAGIDVPVSFPGPDTVESDTLSDTLDQPAVPGVSPPAGRDAATPSAVPAGYTASFAALLSQPRAQALADSIVVGSARARVEIGDAAGVPLYRVVLGPYLTRADADAAGRYTGRQFWIFEGRP